MHDAVLAPLGMTRSTFAQTLPPAWRDAAATAHRGDGSAVPGRWHVHPEAAAGLWTTPTDLARLVVEVQQAQAGRSDKLLSRATASVMLTRVLGEYGLGFFVEQLGADSSFSHSGGTEGFRSRLYGYTRSGKGAVVMTNSANGAALIEEVSHQHRHRVRLARVRRGREGRGRRGCGCVRQAGRQLPAAGPARPCRCRRRAPLCPEPALRRPAPGNCSRSPRPPIS